MRTKLIKLASAIALSTTVAGSAAAELVAGFDFSGLSGDSASVPASTAADITGPGGSGSVTVASGDVVAAALPPGTNETDAPGIQGGVTAQASVLGDPQFNGSGSEYLGLTARDAASIEFEVDAGAPIGGWLLTFGGLAIPNPSNPASNGESSVFVSFGSTCGATSSIGEVRMKPVDTGYSLFLSGAAQFTTGCVVFDLDGTADQPLIDNVAISVVPEPGVVGMLAAGGLCLAGLARRRRT